MSGTKETSRRKRTRAKRFCEDRHRWAHRCRSSHQDKEWHGVGHCRTNRCNRRSWRCRHGIAESSTHDRATAGLIDGAAGRWGAIRGSSRGGRAVVQFGGCGCSRIVDTTRMHPQSHLYELRPGFCIDLATRIELGEYCDHGCEERRDPLEKSQDNEKPAWLKVSPLSADFCKLRHLKLSKQEMAHRQEKHGKPFVRACVKACWRQLAIGSHCLHGHPSSSGPRGMPEI